MLEDGKYAEYASWNEDGTVMVIKKSLEFAEKVLPCFFKHQNLSSFIRQMNMYNFKKRKDPENDLAYAHELFCRGKKHLLSKIMRKSNDKSNSSVQDDSTFDGEASRDEVHEKQDLDQEIQRLRNENFSLRRSHEYSSYRMAEISRKLAELENENQRLFEKNQAQSKNEEYLRSIINAIVANYGISLNQGILQSIQKVYSNEERKPEWGACQNSYPQKNVYYAQNQAEYPILQNNKPQYQYISESPRTIYTNDEDIDRDSRNAQLIQTAQEKYFDSESYSFNSESRENARKSHNFSNRFDLSEDDDEKILNHPAFLNWGILDDSYV